MPARTHRRDGRLWSAVLVVSVLALIGSSASLLSEHQASAQLPVTDRLAPAETASSPSSSPAHSAPPTRRAESRGPSGWTARDARPPKLAPAAVPKRLVIAEIGVRIPIEPTGVDPHGSMALPEHPDRAGWYALGPAPGDARGSAVIAAHVDSARFGTGPLAALGALREGDRVRVEGKRRVEFRVAAVQRISKQKLDTAALFARDGAPVLRIVTCGGRYDAARGGYEDNVVVTAEPLH